MEKIWPTSLIKKIIDFDSNLSIQKAAYNEEKSWVDRFEVHFTDGEFLQIYTRTPNDKHRWVLAFKSLIFEETLLR